MASSSSSELISLDYKLISSYSINQNQNPIADHMHKLQDFLARLEEESLKIEAFKRELPLCMQLLNNAMEAYRKQLETYQASQEAQPVLEEFIPLKKTSVEESEMANWMVSAQLWSSPAADEADSAKQGEEEHSLVTFSSKLVLDAKPRIGGAFQPFSKQKKKDISELALARSIQKEMEEKESCSKSNEGEEKQGKREGSCSVSSDVVAPAATQRKARRCWSPELHRRFVNALHILGGSQDYESDHWINYSSSIELSILSTVATPKQIRELMNVDGLTNDEVKSHLQVLSLSLSSDGAATCSPRRHLGPTRVRHVSSSSSFGRGSGDHTLWRQPLAGALLPSAAALPPLAVAIGRRRPSGFGLQESARFFGVGEHRGGGGGDDQRSGSGGRRRSGEILREWGSL
ncbi:Putative Myb family transcription factor [Dendrobium catenatum]|uniref:Myb family transcription factor n=1 Tax=Dendrobium catenatum TaxID=906689 RepID=A0A2I0WBC3_9ASPA|nr:Putative Myb family transcription factor [Dendrobium catenatum]